MLSLPPSLHDQMVAHCLGGLPEEAWSRTGVHNERGLMTLEEMLRAEAEHVPHHLGQILEKRKALGRPAEA